MVPSECKPSAQDAYQHSSDHIKAMVEELEIARRGNIDSRADWHQGQCKQINWWCSGLITRWDFG
jgi:hypothetical protein